MLSSVRVGLALGGGAARGLAHLGVIRGLLRLGIPIDLIAGTSMGAIVGGAYAATGDIDEVERRVRDVLQTDAFRKNRLSFLKESKRQRGGLLYSAANLVRRGIFYGKTSLRPSFLSAEEFADSLAAVLPDTRIERTRVPFGAVALDVESAEEVLLLRGPLRQAARASSAIPGILPAVAWNGRRLIDGGWIDKVPVLPAFRMGADLVVAVDITEELREDRDQQRGIDIMLRAYAIRDTRLVSCILELADEVVEPDVKHVHWADFASFEQCIAAGDAAATTAAPGIERRIRRARWGSWILRPRSRRIAERFLASSRLRLVVDG